MLQVLNRRVEFYGMLEPHIQYNVPHALAGVLLPYVLSLVEQTVGALYLAYCLGKPQRARCDFRKLGRWLDAVVQRFHRGRHVLNETFEAVNAQVPAFV